MGAQSTPSRQSIGCLGYAIGGASFIPLAGVPLGVISIVWGLVAWKRGGWKLALLGLGGILFTVVLYSSLFYFGFVQRGGIYDSLRAQLAQQQLTDLVKSVEFFKMREGRYPTSLEELESRSEEAIFIMDPACANPFTQGDPRPYHYELDPSGRFYYLLSAGCDGQPFTEDDILPNVEVAPDSAIGYRVKQ